MWMALYKHSDIGELLGPELQRVLKRHDVERKEAFDDDKAEISRMLSGLASLDLNKLYKRVPYEAFIEFLLWVIRLRTDDERRARVTDERKVS